MIIKIKHLLKIVSNKVQLKAKTKWKLKYNSLKEN